MSQKTPFAIQRPTFRYPSNRTGYFIRSRDVGGGTRSRPGRRRSVPMPFKSWRRTQTRPKRRSSITESTISATTTKLATSSSSGRKDRQTAKRTPTLATFGQPELHLRSGFYDLGISQDGRRQSVPIHRPKCNLQTRNEWKARPHAHHPKGRRRVHRVPL